MTFKVKIPSDASQDTYSLPLTIQYTYLDRADQLGTDALQYFYKTTDVTLGVPVRIKREVVP